MKKLPEGWKEIELGDVFDFQAKSKIQAGEGSSEGKYKFFTSSDVQSKFINEAIFDGEYLIFSTGGSAGVHYCNEKFSTSTDCFIVKVNDILLAKYVYYYLFTNIHLLEAGFKGAGLKHISKDYIRKIRMMFPEKKETQQKIVSILEKAEQAKEMRKQADELTKDFLKSVFMEMFGDPIKNNKKWNMMTLINIASKEENSIKRGPFGGSLKKEIFVKQGYKVYEQQNAIYNNMLLGNYFVTKEKYAEMIDFAVKPGDFIISCSGTMGKIALVPKGSPEGIINQALLKLSLDKSKVDNTFFKFFFSSEVIQNHLFNISRGSGISNFPPMSIIRELKIPLPPLELQLKFASVVKEVESMKEQQKHSKEQIDNLFNALMQKAFKGELI